MEKEKEKQDSKQPYPPSEFWRALLAVRNHTFANGLNEYFAEHGIPAKGSFRESMDIVDNYLDLAINERWLEGWRW